MSSCMRLSVASTVVTCLLAFTAFAKDLEKADPASVGMSASGYAVVGVMVADTAQGVRVAVTGAGACAFRQADMEAALAKSFTVAAIKDIVISADDLNADMHATAEYRAHLRHQLLHRTRNSHVAFLYRGSEQCGK